MNKPRGTEDYFGLEKAKYNFIEDKIKNICKNFNISEFQTPMFEDLNLFVRAVGEETDVVSKEMFELVQKGKTKYALRPEGTAPIARSVIENKLVYKNDLPLKYFYIENMFRYERPQKGRLRQFKQFGVEFIGVDSYLLSLETIFLAQAFIKTFNLPNVTLKINYLVTNESRQNYIIDLKKQLEKLTLCDDCKIRINKNVLRVLDCKIDNHQFKNLVNMKDYLSQDEINDFALIKQALKNNNINFEEDTKLVRGLDYYTGFVFEYVFTINNREVTLLGGGSYNNLFSQLGSKDSVPAVGFAMGVERLIMLLESNNAFNNIEPKLDGYFITLSTDLLAETSNIINELRNNNLKVDWSYKKTKNLNTEFKKSEKHKTKFVIILGEKEFKNNSVVIKNQETNEQSTVLISGITKFIKKNS